MSDTGKFGPRMLALSKRQRAFVRALVEQGSRNYTEAAKAAGYGRDPKTGHMGSYGGLKVTAHKLAHDDKIQAAIHEETQRRLKGLLPLATKVIGDILENPQAKEADRLKAATITMDRSGLHAVTEHINTNRLADDPEKLKAIEVLARTLGLPVEKLIGNRLALEAPKEEPMAIDVEFEDVAEHATEGLEGLI